jgi:lipopolysaccharide export system protein LptA
VTQDGDVQVTTGTTAINAAGQNITLDRDGNDFGGRVTVYGQDVILDDANTLNLVANVTGSLTTAVGGNIHLGTTVIDDDAGITAFGTVTQSGDLTVNGRLWVNAAGQTVTLDGPNNNFRSRVTVTGRDVTLRARNSLDLAATVSGRLVTTSQGLNLGPSTVAGTALLNAGGFCDAGWRRPGRPARRRSTPLARIFSSTVAAQ